MEHPADRILREAKEGTTKRDVVFNFSPNDGFFFRRVKNAQKYKNNLFFSMRSINDRYMCQGSYFSFNPKTELNTCGICGKLGCPWTVQERRFPTTKPFIQIPEILCVECFKKMTEETDRLISAIDEKREFRKLTKQILSAIKERQNAND